MTKPRCEIVIYWSKGDDDTYVAEVSELSGCMADGAAYGEALTAAE